MPEKVRAVRHLEFLPDRFDGGSNQVSFSIKLKAGVFGYWIQHIHLEGFWGALGVEGCTIQKESYCAESLLSCSF